MEKKKTVARTTNWFHPSTYSTTHDTGAGSVMEALDLGKALLVVVNTGLMDDHQQELARAMEEQVRNKVAANIEGCFVRGKAKETRSDHVHFRHEVQVAHIVLCLFWTYK